MKKQAGTVTAHDDDARRVLGHEQHSKMVLQTLRHTWYDALAFVRGDQWGFWDAGLGRMRQRPSLPWKQRITDNQVLALKMQQLALLIEKQPTFTALGRTDEDDDRQAAMAFEGLLAWQWDRLDLTDELAEALNCCVITGNGFWRVDWSAAAGQSLLAPVLPGSGMVGGNDAPTIDDGVDQTVMLPDGEVLEEHIPVGDISVVNVSPFAMHVDPIATKLKRARWVMQESYVHLDVIRDVLGSKVAERLTPDVEASAFYAYELAQRSDSSILSIGDVRNHVRVLECWEAPDRKHPNGRVYTVANGRTLDAKDNPYEGRYPYVHFSCIKVDGCFWAEGFVKHERPLAVLHNRSLSRYTEIMNLMGNPKWVADKVAGIKETGIDDRPGEVIIINPGGTLKALDAPPPPTIHPQIMGMALNSLQTISGINDPLAGNNPANVRSGRSLAFLQESGMRRFVPLALQTESALRQAGRMILYLTKKYYKEDRMVRIVGPNSRAQVVSIRAADVQRVEDVTIAPGSMIPSSKAAKQDIVLDLLQNAPALLMNDAGQVDKARVFHILDMPSASGRLDPDDADRLRAQRELVMMRAGEQVNASPWENHKVHMAEHRTALLSEVNEQDPALHGALAAHWQEHLQMSMPPMPAGAPGAGPPPGRTGQPPALPPGQGPADNPLLAGFLAGKMRGGAGGAQGSSGTEQQPLGPRNDMAGGSK